MRGDVEQDLLALIAGRAGHFLLESGHHGETWLDLDSLFLRPAALEPAMDVLAEKVARATAPQAICGPLFGGALVANAVATRLGVELFVAEPIAEKDAAQELFRARYSVLGTTRELLQRKRITVIDDVINAGSATRATVTDLRAAEAVVVGVGALVVLGDHAPAYASRERFPLVHVATMPNRLWLPDECPLCRTGEPLTVTAR